MIRNMKKFYTTLNCFALSAFLFSLSVVTKAQTASHSTGVPAWTTSATVSSTSGASFSWANTTTPGQFQKNYTTAVTSPILQFQNGVAHTSVSIALDLQATTSTSTISSYTITLIWGVGGANQVSVSGSGFNVASSSPSRHNFTINGIYLPNLTAFQVRVALVIPISEKDVNSSNFKSDATLAASGTVLAVQMNSFSANRSSNNVTINWTTNYESNNRGFEIQRRFSYQNDFETISFVNTKATNGNSTTINNYSYVDANNSSAVTYYRIRQVNNDGTAKYSLIRQVDGNKTKAQTMVYPNPAVNGTTNLVFTTNESRTIQVSDMSGRVVKNWNNYTYQDLKISNLKSGVYFLQINTANGEKETQRIVVTQ
jgi:hypothetical protein